MQRLSRKQKNNMNIVHIQKHIHDDPTMYYEFTFLYNFECQKVGGTLRWMNEVFVLTYKLCSL